MHDHIGNRTRGTLLAASEPEGADCTTYKKQKRHNLKDTGVITQLRRISVKRTDIIFKCYNLLHTNSTRHIG